MGKYKKVYVVAPFGHCTGGVELAHQLVDYLRNKQVEAYIVYAEKGEKSISKDQTITANYSKYNLKSTSIIEDSPENILVLPEIYFEFILKYKNIKIACWWMSVDFRYTRTTFREMFRFKKNFRSKLGLEGYCREFKNDNALLKKENRRILHLYQSHYAQYHLYSNGFSHLLPLSDYINLDLVGDVSCAKRNVVLYNPAKGYEFTKKIIVALPDVKFVPLKGLNREQLRELLETSKLYIDFGHFPGKDRLPREAVSNGCCIMTGKLGASYFYEDVPVGDIYKFDVCENSIPSIVAEIKYILDNYESCKFDFDFYRNRVRKEQEIFYQEIEEIFI
mgnify:FL=1